MVMGSQYYKELAALRNELKNIPLVGILSYYQFAPINIDEFLGQTYIHNHSICSLILGER